jgi:hypothetical protein
MFRIPPSCLSMQDAGTPKGFAGGNKYSKQYDLERRARKVGYRINLYGSA